MVRFRTSALIALNLLCLPGLGSLLAGRRVSGVAQMLFALVGFALGLVWFVQLIALYAGQDEFPDLSALPFGALVTGVVLFAAAWLWALASSLQILRDARKTKV